MARKRYPNSLNGIENSDEIPENRKEAFIFGTEEAGLTLPIAAGLSISGSIQISQEADFVCTKVVRTHVLGAATNTYSVEIVMGDTDRQLQNVPIPQDNMFGTAQLPAILSMPRILWRNTTIKFRASRIVAGATGSDLIWFALHGYKVFYDLSNLNLTSRQM
jgi:hypothetical protein